MREAYVAVDDATRLTPGVFGDLVELIGERISLRDDGEVKPDIAPGTIIKDLHGNTVNWSRSEGRHYSADHCPFCGEERTFRVAEGVSLWSCSACLPAGSRVGGPVEWMMLMDNVSGVEAVRRLRARGWLKTIEQRGQPSGDLS